MSRSISNAESGAWHMVNTKYMLAIIILKYGKKQEQKKILEEMSDDRGVAFQVQKHIIKL